ncbi:unnamed protein product [Adineta steineri]|uniref:B box-type domain-containing protein n=2 Tax=Adineta steineri TaxID=433720 RepID=A0A819PL14_9BILA|nr:unnamed protein product [Adineta steineri]CAF4009730.1 unnamed protein product [Adineta steineri]
MSSKRPCVACENKDANNGIFKCEGCLQIFCLKHTNEHRYFLDYQLDDIILEHKTLFNENQQQSSLLFDQINQWEKDSILKIKQTAQKTRKEIQGLFESQKQYTKENFSDLAKQLENARENHEYIENDLHRWKILLEQFKYDLTILSPSVVLNQDQDETLIKNISISKINEQIILTETLVSDSNHIQFDDNHHIAMHCGPYRTPAYINGTQEYSSGQYKIRLFISKKTSEFILSFNIMSKLMENSSESEILTYGWQSDDFIIPSQYYSPNEQFSPDLKGKTKFHIEFLIDCDNTKISYFNEKTKRTRVINVDIEKCPLPWKLYFYLYDVGDSVRLLSSTQIKTISN